MDLPFEINTHGKYIPFIMYKIGKERYWLMTMNIKQ